MNPERWKQIKDVFAAVVEQPTESRLSMLSSLCREDPDLQTQVERLLSHHDEMSGFLEGSAPGVPAGPEDALKHGDRLAGRYDIVKFLGSGGMGEVYEGHDIELGERIALKVIRRQMLLAPDTLDRLRREVQLARRVTHPNVCRVFDLGYHREQNREIIFLTMELINGETLTDRLKRSGKIAPRESLKIAEQLCLALGAAHQAGILHRDFKCGNVMLMGSGEQVRAVVTDFGIARWIKAEAAEAKDKPQAFETRQGMVMGTPAYMSPEQLLGQALTPASDIYSLGLVLYETVTNMRPFRGESSWTETLKRLSVDPPPPVTIVPDLGPNWNNAILKCLARDPGQRFSSTQQVVEALMPEAFQAAARPATALSFIPEKGQRWLLTTAAIIVIAAAAALGSRIYFSSSSTHSAIAVMPLTYNNSDPNAANEPERDYLADGLTENLIDAISAVSDAEVISRTSVFRYRGRDTDPREVGRDLNVSSILYGKILRQGNDLKINLELVDASSRRHLWGNQYDATMSTLMALPKDVALQLAKSLSFRLRNRSLGFYTASPTAYQEYLRGRHSWNKRTEDGIKAAIGHFQSAIAADPQYAMAYAGLADAYHVLWIYSGTSPRDGYLKAKPAALKALELDPELAEAHTSMAVIKADDEWDFGDAEREFRKSIELDPNYATTHQWYAQCRSYRGQFDDAIAELRTAIRLDPLSPIIHATLGDVLYRARRYGQAAEELKKALDLDSSFPLAHSLMRYLDEAKGDFAKAIEDSKAATIAWGGDPQQAEAAVEDLRRGYSQSGEKGYWQAQLRLSQKRIKQGVARGLDDSSFRMAGIYARLADDQQAFQWLTKAYDERDANILYLKIAPEFDRLRADPRAIELMKRIGL
ncbi:MAG TPA: protein kinase [Candidatus Saccharimonadales bacterium]|jgi:serine/threonine protein kinase|nr:protein kinase [Candidatus Saccharimonadales bacterium]